ncbi:ATP-binding protein [Pseudonocardia nigra]|uniref:ATP-binding protein n=1 Tax=Pseudonocardia nigra TaxID=1921578 RepID=UPI001C5CC7E2|nr:BTAD domain-containing putative transcriptional regulator [Pseudonocardia nigra]
MRITLLGAVEVRPDGAGDGPLPLGGLRLRGLLARLALDAGHPVGLRALVDDLWGAAAPDEPGNALQALVSRLRRAIGTERVETTAAGYRLAVDPDAVDALRFTGLVTTSAAAAPAAAPALLTEALGLWRGPALADVRALPFAEPAAHRLDERRAIAVEERARLALRLGDPTAGLDALRDQLAAHPLRETTAALLARGLHATGRRADALAVLDRTRSRLAEELGVDPGGELRAAQQAVLRGDAAPARRDPQPPPAPPLTSFVGRTRDVERIRGLLDTTRLVTLTGPGGAGKTRLARETTADRDHRVAELAALTDPEQLPSAVLAAVGGPELLLRVHDETEQDPSARLVTALAGRRLVLVLDNCEHLVDDVARLAETLLHACPQLRVLATSREPLGVPGEVLHPVGALPEADAVRLFADRGAAVRPGFALTPDVAPAVAEICRRLDGQPLPIELAAARLRTLSPTEIDERLDDRFRLLTSGARTALPRHQTLRAVVDWSWDLLAEPERAVARRLAVFAGGATLAAAEPVCGLDGGEDVLDLLAALVDKSLVVAVPQPDGAPTRYRMLETIRAYAGERLDEAGERAAAEAAHAAVVLELVEAAEPRLRGADQLHWLGRLRAESDEIAVALHRAVRAGDGGTAHRLVAGMAWSWVIRGQLGEATRWIEAVHVLDGSAVPAHQAVTTAYLSLVHVGRGDVAGAQRHADAAVAMAADLPRPPNPVLELLAPAYRMFNASDDGPLRRLAAESSDPWVRAIALQLVAQLAENDGRIDEQREHVRAAHALFTSTGDRFGLGMVVHALGELEDIAGRHDAAARAYDEAITLATELANDDDLPRFLTRRAMLAARHGDLAVARALLDRATEVGRGPFTSGMFTGIALAHVERLAGDLDAARAHLAVAAEDASADGIALAQRAAVHAAALAAVELAAGDRGAAGAALTAAVDHAMEAQDGPVAAAVADLAARFALEANDPACAAELLGVAAAQRGAVDRGDPEVLAAHAAARDAIGPDAYERSVRRGRELPRGDGLALLRDYVRRR